MVLKNLSTLVWNIFFGKIKYIAVKIWLFLTIGVFNKDINTIKKLQEIMVIIFRTFSCLTKFLFHHKWSKAWLLDPRPKKGPIKPLLSVCLPLRPSVQSFSQIWLIILSDFWHNGRKLEYLKTDKVLFSKKIHFWRNLSKQDPKWSQNFFFYYFLKNFVISFS